MIETSIEFIKNAYRVKFKIDGMTFMLFPEFKTEDRAEILKEQLREAISYLTSDIKSIIIKQCGLATAQAISEKIDKLLEK